MFAEQYYTIGAHHKWFSSPVNGYWGHFHSLSITSKAGMNIYVQAEYEHML